ncbi:Uu.00g035380.m01.CDS01 [Anthostomella pinea]|uniref:Uu.00g035380.m01.CDS01 n=1 Tax=Anthostomella pinea TaxID=933095 RepID=A0AAI8YDF3_9PEZI|nr:Uu.00g035380.m01.CDS01 [Anthostomella pinea]
MLSDVNISRRPSLEPIWTTYHNLDGMPKTAFRPNQSPMLSPSPMSPKTLPSPMYPSSYDGSMRRQQDRALVNSLDQTNRLPSLSSPITLATIEEQSPLVSRLEKISILPPIDFSMKHGLPTPASPELSPPRELPRTPEVARPAPIRGLLELSAHGSNHPAAGHYVPISPVSPPTPRKDSTVQPRDQLQKWGHVNYGNAKTADAFVIARSLRRHSNTMTEASHFTSSQSTFQSPKLRAPNRLTVRAIIRPRAVERQAFLIQRNFDIDQLRATVPDPPTPQSARSTSSSEAYPSPSALAIRSSPLLGSLMRRPSSARSASVLSSRDLRSAHDHESLIRDAKAVPIHLNYMRACLPVLAVLLVSGHVREGDVIYLPMAHAEAWPQTLRYVYTGQGELTQAMSENILYLGGKV